MLEKIRRVLGIEPPQEPVLKKKREKYAFDAYDAIVKRIVADWESDIEEGKQQLTLFVQQLTQEQHRHFINSLIRQKLSTRFEVTIEGFQPTTLENPQKRYQTLLNILTYLEEREQNVLLVSRNQR